MNVAECLAQGQVWGLPRLESQILLLFTLGRPHHDRAWLIAHDTDQLTAAQVGYFEALVQRRLHHEPVAYIVGEKEFFGLTLQIDKRVLDPRDDTEVLVEWALSCSDSFSKPRFLDLGTGSGAIALSLDVSLLKSDWLDQVKGEFEVIVSNPPYIEGHDPHLERLKHEPLKALVSGQNGLEDIRKIIHQAQNHLVSGGWLLIEHGWQQAADVRALLAAAGYQNVQSKLDLAGVERCSGGQK